MLLINNYTKRKNKSWDVCITLVTLYLQTGKYKIYLTINWHKVNSLPLSQKQYTFSSATASVTKVPSSSLLA